MPSKGQSELDTDLAFISAAKSNGFLDCYDIMRGLGYDTTKVSWSGAYWQIEDAGEDVVYVLPEDGIGYYIDGRRKTISKGLRTGLYTDVFERVKAYREAVDANRKHEEWSIAMESALHYRELYGDGGLMNWTVYIESLGPEPVVPGLDTESVRRGGIQKRAEAQAQEVASRGQRILEAARTYDGPVNRKGYNKLPAFRRHAGIQDITREEERKAEEVISAEG